MPPVLRLLLVSLLLLTSGCLATIKDRDRDGYDAGADDCDDADPAVHVGAEEICDGKDNDCNGQGDDADMDSDGFGFCDGDCDDTNYEINPTAQEICDALDNDCDGDVDGPFDEDGDGVTTCGYDGVPATEDDDCDDQDPLISPRGDEFCNGEDDDCDDRIDEDFDEDGDDITTCQQPVPDCDDNDPAIHPGAAETCDGVDHDCDGIPGNFDGDGDGFAACQGDCDDTNLNVGPGQVETCDGQDQNCNGEIDETFDADNDSVTSCGPDGVSGTGDDDCNDSDPAIKPGATELCDQVDQNCNGQIDDGFDVDADGYTSCALPLSDCDDANPDVHPGHVEVCDGADNNCDGVTDEGFDLDGDGWAPCAGDCDDTSFLIHPGAAEVCNNADDDCDTLIDETYDLDADGYSSCAQPVPDCDDDDPLISPGAGELCDGDDQDCDGLIDEEFDNDGDLASQCGPDGTMGTADDGCNDNDPDVYPGALEACDGQDTDCNGFVPPAEADGDLDGSPQCEPDCDDNDPTRYPNNLETCDDIDNNCDEQVDEGFDTDGDGYTTCGGDCDDDDPSNNPGVPEIPDDGIDQDCTGTDSTMCFEDVDEDGVGVPDQILSADEDCDDLGESDQDDDCDDDDPDTYPGAPQSCTAVDNDCDGQPGDTDADLDGSQLCEDCDDSNANVYPGAGFEACDGTDWDCDGAPELSLRVAVLPGQAVSWTQLSGLNSLATESLTLPGCELEFVDLPEPVTEAALIAAQAHIAFISSPGEACVAYDSATRDELKSWLDGPGRGLVLTGDLGDDSCQPLLDRLDLATLAGVTLSTTAATSVTPTLTEMDGLFWDSLPAGSMPTGGDGLGHGIFGYCTGGTLDATYGSTKQVVAYAPSATPCASGHPTHYRAVFLPYQPEDGGTLNDRRYLYNALHWIVGD